MIRYRFLYLITWMLALSAGYGPIALGQDPPKRPDSVGTRARADTLPKSLPATAKPAPRTTAPTPKVTPPVKKPPKAAVTSKPKVKADTARAPATAGSPAKLTGKPTSPTEKDFFSDLNNILIRLELQNAAGKVGSTDSTVVLLPVPVKEKSPPGMQLRLVEADSLARSPFEIRLIFDSVGAAAAYLARMQDSTRAFAAHLQANEKELILKLQPPAEKPRLNTAGVSAPAGKLLENDFLQKIAYLFLFLTGVFSLLWATSRLLVFSVKVQNPAAGESVPNGIIDPEPAVPAPERNRSETNLPSPEPGRIPTATEPLPGVLITETQPPAAASQPLVVTNMPEPAASRYFLAEIMLTAGPRKKYMSDPESDKDLGEDVCGLVSNGRQLLLWLLDGTSDQYCLKNPATKREYFSSRLLAQSMANKLRASFNLGLANSFDELIAQAIREVKTDWLRTISQLPAAEQEIIKANIKRKNIPECATTLLIGQLAINGDLIVYRSGDSKMVLYNTLATGKSKCLETSLAGKKEESNDRLFFRLDVNTQDTIDILFNVPTSETLQLENVQTLIAFSDGIGMETEMLLKQPETLNFEAIRQEIIYQLQGTADDKSICFIQIKDEATGA